MIARGVTPRFAIGTSNAVIFFVALATSLTLWLQLGMMRYDIVVALLIGGAAAAPIAARVTSHVPHRAAATAVGLVVFVLGATVHDAHLKRPGRALLPRGTGGVWSAVHLP